MRNMSLAPDFEPQAIWAYAQKSKMVLISKDEDFASAAWQSRKGPQVLWVRIGNSTNRVLRQAFQDVLPEILQALEAGERVIEIISREKT
jgi:predicted nuclease of predicted toxin-antitoxin system